MGNSDSSNKDKDHDAIVPSGTVFQKVCTLFFDRPYCQHLPPDPTARDLLLFSFHGNLVGVRFDLLLFLLINIRWSLFHGASPNTKDALGTTPLHAAARSGSVDVVSELIGASCDLNMADCAGWTALHVAVFMSNVSVVKALLMAGVNTKKQDKEGKSPLELCCNPQIRTLLCAFEPMDNSISVETSQEPLHTPSFVPRCSACTIRPHPQLLSLGAYLFNICPGVGLAFLISVGRRNDTYAVIN